MARFTLLAALSLDGTWRSGALPPARLLKSFGIGGEVVTDLPSLRSPRRRIPGLRWMEADAIAAGPGRPVLGTPALHARLLEAKAGAPALLLLRLPEVIADPDRATLAGSFLPADGKRSRFVLRALRTVPDGVVCRYTPRKRKNSARTAVPH